MSNGENTGVNVGEATGSSGKVNEATGFTHKENFNGFYTGEQAAGTNNLPLRTDIAWWGQGSSNPWDTLVVDLNDVAGDDTTGGLGAAAPISHPKIGVSDIPSGRGGDAVDGALLVRYEPGTQKDSDQKFGILNNGDASGYGLPAGQFGINDFWVQYDVFIPSNFYDRDHATLWGSKWAFFSTDGNMSGVTPLFVMGRSNKANGDSSMTGEYQYTPVDGEAKIYDHVKDSSEIIVEQAIDNGKWQRITYHVKPAITISSNDGIIQFWVKHGDNTVKTHYESFASPAREWDQDYFNSGYFFGWSNVGFTDPTSFLLTNIIFSESSDSIDKTATTL